MKLEDSLVVQFLRFLTSSAGVHVRSLLSKLRPWKPHHVLKKERKKKLVSLTSQFKLDCVTKHSLAWHLFLNVPFHSQTLKFSRRCSFGFKCTIKSQNLFPLSGLFGRFYHVLYMLIPEVHLQLLYPSLQRTDSTSRWALSNACCPTAPRPSLQTISEKPRPGRHPGEPPQKARSPGHGEMGSKWRQQALRKGPGWVWVYMIQTGYFRVRHD